MRSDQSSDPPLPIEFLDDDNDSPDFDDDSTLEIDDDLVDALEPDDDYETLPDASDFWIEDAA